MTAPTETDVHEG